MSINWAMLDDTKGLVLLPNERVVYTSPPRTSLSLQSIHTHPEKEQFSKQSSAGCVHLTNQRIVYLPTNPTQQFQSFSAPLLNLLDTHVAAPFFGPNIWTAKVQPVAGGNIPPSYSIVQLKMTFKEGGAFDFHSNFERIKERLQQVVEQARESGALPGNGSQMGAVNFSNVHLDELPAYEGPAGSANTPSNTLNQSTSQPPNIHASATRDRKASNAYTSDNSFEPPTEPPPGYEEVQQQSVANELEDQLRRRL